MAGSSSNIGQTGVESIRLNGCKVEDLPIAEAARVQPQIALAHDTERKNKIAGVLKKYPTQRVDYLEGRIREAKHSQESMANLALAEQQRIMEYQGHIEMCKHRDREIARLQADTALVGSYPQTATLTLLQEDADAAIKALKIQFPYVIDRLEAQIEISQASIERFNKVVQRESHDIDEMGQVLGLCKQRDLELRNLGARQATG